MRITCAALHNQCTFRGMTNPEVPQTRYTFGSVVPFDHHSSFGLNVRAGEYPLAPWCYTAQGAWDYVKYATKGLDSIAVYRDGERIAVYGRVQNQGPVMEWQGYNTGWVPVKDRRDQAE